MDSKTTEGQSGCTTCDTCQHGHACAGGMSGRHHWGCVLVKILLVIFIFWCGVQLGELKGMLDRGYGFERGGMMGWYGAENQGYYRGGPAMMYDNTDATAPRSASTTAR